jgi:prepilin peptidase CpaA
VSAIVPHAMLWTISLCALIWGAVSDLRLRIIPDRVSLLVAASGLTLAFTLRPVDIYASLGAFVLVFIGLCAIAYYDLVGGGDVKLISAVSLLVPSNDVVVLLLEIALAGGLLSCAYLLARSQLKKALLPPREGRFATQLPWPTAPGSFRQEAARIIAGEPMPYAFAILGGVVFHGARELYQCRSAVCCLF